MAGLNRRPGKETPLHTPPPPPPHAGSGNSQAQPENAASERRSCKPTSGSRPPAQHRASCPLSPLGATLPTHCPSPGELTLPYSPFRLACNSSPSKHGKVRSGTSACRRRWTEPASGADFCCPSGVVMQEQSTSQPTPASAGGSHRSPAPATRTQNPTQTPPQPRGCGPARGPSVERNLRRSSFPPGTSHLLPDPYGHCQPRLLQRSHHSKQRPGFRQRTTYPWNRD